MKPRLVTALTPLALAAFVAMPTFAQAPDEGPRPPPRPEWQDPDTNGDCLISDAEAEAAIERRAEHMRDIFEWHNERVLEHFDTDGDGALTGDELKKAQAARERRLERRKERREEWRERRSRRRNTAR